MGKEAFKKHLEEIEKDKRLKWSREELSR